jgi:hypothetical protein
MEAIEPCSLFVATEKAGGGKSGSRYFPRFLFPPNLSRETFRLDNSCERIAMNDHDEINTECTHNTVSDTIPSHEPIDICGRVYVTVRANL